jgi:hypothetical protein
MGPLENKSLLYRCLPTGYAYSLRQVLSGCHDQQDCLQQSVQTLAKPIARHIDTFNNKFTQSLDQSSAILLKHALTNSNLNTAAARPMFGTKQRTV